MVTTLIGADDDGSGPDWLSTAEAVRYLGITPRTLYRFIDSGLLPATRFGRLVRVRRSDLDALLRTRNGDGGP